MNDLRLRLLQLTKEKNAADTSTENGRKEFKKLQKEILSTTSELKELDEASREYFKHIKL